MNYKKIIIPIIIFSLLKYSALASSQIKVHFLIPGGAGGGWDTSARGIGEALSRSKLINSASYENLSGGDGSKAMAYLIETASRQTNTLMISSTPIILKSLKNIFPQSYKDLTPVCTVIADYGAFVVKADSKYTSWQQVIADFKKDPRNVKVAGGSVRGGMDHLVAALAFKKSGLDPKQVRYIPYNAGAKAMVGLLSGETQLLSSGLSESIALAAQGEVRILAMTAEKRLDYVPDIPTLAEQNVDVTFTNWRGFFAAPGLSIDKISQFESLFLAMYKTADWEKIRSIRGWENLFISGKAFTDFLQNQENEMSAVMTELGMLPQS